MESAWDPTTCSSRGIQEDIKMKEQKRTSSTINLSPGEVEEEDDDENTCGPSGLWEALTPCNGCRNLGFPMLAQESYLKKRNYTMEIVPSASLDTFPSENENFLCELMDTAVTKKPCSLEIARVPSPRADNASEVAITAPGTSNHRNSSTGPTPDCSPPSPDTALKNIVKVIRPQPKQRTSIVSSLDFHRMNHNQEYFEISTSTVCASSTSSPPVSPPTSSVGTMEVKNEGTDHTGISIKADEASFLTSSCGLGWTSQAGRHYYSSHGEKAAEGGFGLQQAWMSKQATETIFKRQAKMQGDLTESS
nr:ankyrin repeat and sterile alpha motif domain-containing protein 1B-like [Cavia porcellus]